MTTRRRTSPTDPTFRLTVPPGEGMLYVQARGKDLPYLTARLRKADKGKGIGGTGDGETYTVLLNAHHAYKIIDVPADARSFHVDLELTRGLSRKGRVVDPDGKPVTGAQCYGLSATWGQMTTLAGRDVRGPRAGAGSSPAVDLRPQGSPAGRLGDHQGRGQPER